MPDGGLQHYGAGRCLGLARVPGRGTSVLDAGLGVGFGHAARNGRLMGGRSALSSILNRTASLTAFGSGPAPACQRACAGGEAGRCGEHVYRACEHPLVARAQASHPWRLTKATDQARAGVVKAGVIRVQPPGGLRPPLPPKGGGTTTLSVKAEWVSGLQHGHQPLRPVAGTL